MFHGVLVASLLAIPKQHVYRLLVQKIKLKGEGVFRSDSIYTGGHSDIRNTHHYQC